MSTPSEAEEAGGRSIVVDDQLATRLVRGYVRWQVTRVSWIFLLAVTAVVIVLGVVLAGLGDPSGAVFAAVLVALVLGILIVWVAIVRHTIRQAYPIGSVAAASVSDDGLVSRTALGSTDARFALFRGVDVAGDALILRTGTLGGVVAIMPRALLSDADVTRLEAGIAAARHR